MNYCSPFMGSKECDDILIDIYKKFVLQNSSSAIGKTLFGNGWGGNDLNNLDNEISALLNEQKKSSDIIIQCSSRKEFEIEIKKYNLSKNEEIFIFLKSRKKNKILNKKLESFLTHVRNSFAHGLFEMVEIDNENYFILEDKISENKISMKALVSHNNLLKIHEIILRGPLKYHEISLEKFEELLNIVNNEEKELIIKLYKKSDDKYIQKKNNNWNRMNKIKVWKLLNNIIINK